MICKHFVDPFLIEPEPIFLHTDDFKYYYSIQIILLNINHLFAHREVATSIAI